MSSPCALYIDTRRPVPEQAWPDRDFAIAYLVMGDLDSAQDFFKTHYRRLPGIAHITCEIMHADTLHILTRQPAVGRVSLPHAMMVDGLADHLDVDAVVTWDHRRTWSYHRDSMSRLIDQNVQHMSVYGLRDFTVWQMVQAWLHDHGFSFYERYHAARPGHESAYQNHIAQCGDVLAVHGWSRLTDHGVMRMRSPRQKQFVSLDVETHYEDRLILGLSNRHGVPLHRMRDHHRVIAVQNGWATVQNDRLCPTDRTLWSVTDAVAALLTG